MSVSLFPEEARDSRVSQRAPVVAILAGGLATRLQPLSATVPKSMMLVAGQPFIAPQLRLLSQQGMCDVVLCLGHLGAQIEDFVEDGRRFGCRVRYSSDGPAPLGTGGAIRRALPLLGDRFAVLYGDSYLTAPLLPAFRAFEASGRDALMTIFRNLGQFDASNVEAANGEIIHYDKSAQSTSMEYIDYGLSFYSRGVFLRWPESACFDLAEAQRVLVAEKSMAAFEVSDRFYEIGSPQGLRETEDYLLKSLAVAVPVLAEVSA